MHITVTPLAISKDKKQAERFTTCTAMLRRQYDASELTFMPIEYLDDPNNIVSIWSNIQAADIVVVLISEEFLVALDALTDMQSGNNLIRDEVVAKRDDPQFRVIPVILRACSWDESGSIFKGRGATPRYGSIAENGSPDKTWLEVSQTLRAAIEAARKQDQATPPPALTPKVTTKVAPSYCRRCGSPLLANSTYCRSCGTEASVKPAPRQPKQSGIASSSVLLVYSIKDKSVVTQCCIHLRASGIQMIDSHAISPGSTREDFVVRMRQASCAVFLVSADLISEMYSTEYWCIPAIVRQEIPDAILAKSYMVVVKACYYDALFLGVQPQVVLAQDRKPFGSSRYQDESWLSLAQLIQANI